MKEETVLGIAEARMRRRATSLASARALGVFILLAALVAALLGLFDRGGNFPGGLPSPGLVRSSWGEEVRLAGEGLYRRDSFSAATQERAQDLVTLVFGLPLLAYALFASRRASLRGRLILAGSLGYFLYCYGMMAVGTAYNELFLLYVGLFATSLFAFFFALSSIDADEAMRDLADGYPRRSIAVFCLLVAAFLSSNWVGGVVLPSLLGGKAPRGLEASTTLFVQALDLGVLVPVAALVAFWLLRRDPRGYVLGTVLLVKGAAEGLAVAAMGFNMLRSGISESIGLVFAFLALALAAVGLGIKALSRAPAKPVRN